MSTAPSYLDKKGLGTSRAGTLAGGPPSPHTPQRNPPSTFSSPGLGYRTDEDYIIFEVGARHISAGFTGDSHPKCTYRFGKESSRRIGDFRSWLPGYEKGPPLLKKGSQWSSDYELWPLDLRDADMKLVEDRFERAVREIYDAHLLQDSKSKKLTMVLPSALSHPILGILFSLLFRNFQIPAITLLPTAALSLMAAGQRSGVVVDIGWHETVVTAIYELREIASVRTIRAMRSVTLAMAELVDQASNGSTTDPAGSKSTETVKFDFEDAEEAVSRLAWCWPSASEHKESESAALKDSDLDDHDIEQRLASFKIAADVPDKNLQFHQEDLDARITLPNSRSGRQAQVRFRDLATPVEKAIFASSASHRAQDDEEQLIPFLVYKILAEDSADVRSACMSNIVITGGGSNIPGIKGRILEEVSKLIETRGWDLVWGQAPEQMRKRLREINNNTKSPSEPTNNNIKKTTKSVDTDTEDDGEESEIPAADAQQLPDPVMDKIRETASKDILKPISGRLRGVETLGAWEGASIVAALRLKGAVEIDREIYLQHGLAGARSEADVSTARSRQSAAAGLSRTGAESSTWTLGPWA